jgi:hypothetical protein
MLIVWNISKIIVRNHTNLKIWTVKFIWIIHFFLKNYIKVTCLIEVLYFSLDLLFLINFWLLFLILLLITVFSIGLVDDYSFEYFDFFIDYVKFNIFTRLSSIGISDLKYHHFFANIFACKTDHKLFILNFVNFLIKSNNWKSNIFAIKVNKWW